jgi:hypothetical protein
MHALEYFECAVEDVTSSGCCKSGYYTWRIPTSWHIAGLPYDIKEW